MFGSVWYNPKVLANVWSFSEARKLHKVAYAPERDEFTVRVDKGPRVVFKNINGSYLATASEFDAPTRQVCITRVEALDDDELPALVDSDSDSDDESDHGVAPRAEVAMPFKSIEVPTVETTKENEKMFSKRQVRDAQVAKELMRRLGYASVKDEALLVNSGAIVNQHGPLIRERRPHKPTGALPGTQARLSA